MKPFKTRDTENPKWTTWLADVFKIGCGMCLGYIMLIIITGVFFRLVLPSIEAISLFMFGSEL